MKIDLSQFIGKFSQESKEHLQNISDGILILEKDPEAEDVITQVFRSVHTLKGSSKMLKLSDINLVSHKMEDVLGAVRDKKIALNGKICDLLFEGVDTIKACLDAIVGGEGESPDITALCDLLDKVSEGEEIEAETSKKTPKEEEPVEDEKSEPSKVGAGGAKKSFDRELFAKGFEDEAVERLKNIAAGIERLEKNPDDVGLLIELIRSLSALKGTSKILKYDHINLISRRMEDILKGVKEKKLLLGRDVSKLLLRSIRVMESLVQEIDKGEDESSEAKEISILLDRVLRGEKIDTVVSKKGTKKKNPKSKIQNPKKTQTPISEPQENEIQPPTAGGGAKKVQDVQEGELQEETASLPETASIPAKGEKADKLHPLEIEETVRVSINKLDKVIKLAGEIFASQMKSRQRLTALREIEELAKKHHKLMSENSKVNGAGGRGLSWEKGVKDSHALMRSIDKVIRDDKENIALLDLIIGELQDDVLKMRMLPLSTIFAAYPRTIRDLGKSLGKKIDLIIEGEGTELDRKMIEKVNDPLMHMIRNSIDHGIEEPEQRVKKGKPEAGQLKITAGYEGGGILLEVEDDGSGIDVDAIKKKAFKKELVSQRELDSLSDREAMNFVFLPGFSTSKIITDVSGRGLGLDIVKENIEELKGSISLDSPDGKGTTFTIKLPLTVTTLRVLFISTRGRTLAIPGSYIEEAIKITHDDFIRVVDKNAIMLRNELVPIANLGDVLALPGNDTSNRDDLFLVITHSLGKRVGFIVDNILDEEEAVINPLPDPLKRVKNVSGATISGDGEIIVILHVPDLIESTRNISGVREQKDEIEIEVASQRILVVDDSLSTAEIEKSILEAYGYDVDLARDGREALNRIEKTEYDLIVTDIQMPEMDGFTLTQRLRENERYAQVPIVIVTSLEKEEDKKKGIEVGADAYIVKGDFDQTNLVDTISSLIG